MAIAHVCTACGHDLARIRAALDPHYSLPLVRCDRCGACCVRRVHPVLAGFRALRRVDWSLTVLAVQITLLASFALVWIIAVPNVAWELVQQYPGRYTRAHLEALWTVGVIGVFTGTWLRVSFSQFRFHRAVMVWTLLTTAGIAAVSALLNCDQVLWHLLGGDVSRARLWIEKGAIAELSLLLLMCAPAIAVLAVAVWPGKPIGDVILWTLRWMRRELWRHRRRARRRSLVMG